MKRFSMIRSNINTHNNANTHVEGKKHMHKTKFVALVATGLLFSHLTLGFAATDTTTFGVSGTVASNCNLSATAMDFGSAIDMLNLAPKDTGTAVISVTCTTGTAYTIGLNQGTTVGGSIATRKMTDGTNMINYQLFRESGRTSNWGETPPTDTVGNTGSGGDQPVTVYGRILGNQPTTPPGSYNDIITVTITYP